MSSVTPIAMKITYDSLRRCIAAVPEMGEMPLNAILGGFLVLNVPQVNKDGSVSKRPPAKYAILDPVRFATRFDFVVKPQRTRFTQLVVR